MRILAARLMIPGEVEDPEVYAAEPILEFEKSERGLWLKEHSYEQMSFTIQEHPEVWGYGINIWAWLSDKDLTYYTLKWK